MPSNAAGVGTMLDEFEVDFAGVAQVQEDQTTHAVACMHWDNKLGNLLRGTLPRQYASVARWWCGTHPEWLSNDVLGRQLDKRCVHP